MTRLLISFLFLAAGLSAQSFNCSKLNAQLTGTSTHSCGLASGSFNIYWNFYVQDVNFRTGTLVASANPETTGTGYCSGAYVTCGTPYQTVNTPYVSGSSWVWSDQITSFVSSIYPGCARITQSSPSTYLPVQNCPCVSGTCGQYGCPTCCGAIANSQCTAGLQRQYQQVCLATSCSPNCPSTFSLFYTTNGLPCCGHPTPIIIDTDGSGFHLTSAAAGVPFNFYGTGAIQISWTESGSTNAFLVLPQDGQVKDGTELFGNLTPQPSSSDPNGFLALAVYDINGDGVIDAKDLIWTQLRLWLDANHDGISQPQELHTLDEMGIQSISLRYEVDKWTDHNGNQFRYRARIRDVSTDHWAYDVILTTQ